MILWYIEIMGIPTFQPLDGDDEVDFTYRIDEEDHFQCDIYVGF